MACCCCCRPQLLPGQVCWALAAACTVPLLSTRHKGFHTSGPGWMLRNHTPPVCCCFIVPERRVTPPLAAHRTHPPLQRERICRQALGHACLQPLWPIGVAGAAGGQGLRQGDHQHCMAAWKLLRPARTQHWVATGAQGQGVLLRICAVRLTTWAGSNTHHHSSSRPMGVQ